MYGSPKYSGKHVQDPAPFLSLQIAFAPHGDGLQGLVGSCVGGTKSNKKLLNIYIKKFIKSRSFKNCVLTSWYFRTTRKWISCKSSFTFTYRTMFYNCTNCLDTTGSLTWITTFFINTC